MDLKKLNEELTSLLEEIDEDVWELTKKFIAYLEKKGYEITNTLNYDIVNIDGTNFNIFGFDSKLRLWFQPPRFLDRLWYDPDPCNTEEELFEDVHNYLKNFVEEAKASRNKTLRTFL